MNLPLILNLLVFLALLLGLAQTRRTQWSLAKKVLLALVLGVVFGVALHTIYGAGNPVLKASIGWFDLVGNGYVQLLQMIVIRWYLPRSSAQWRACITRRPWARSAS